MLYKDFIADIESSSVPPNREDPRFRLQLPHQVAGRSEDPHRLQCQAWSCAPFRRTGRGRRGYNRAAIELG